MAAVGASWVDRDEGEAIAVSPRKSGLRNDPTFNGASSLDHVES